jgi:hypothetical protein
MHCPNCRHDNAASTRFCTSCGAVLVESTPDGRRRRVLRPWGLLRSAPPTVSPAMPDIVAAARAERGSSGSRRLDLRFAAGTAFVVLAGTFLYPYARALDAPRIEHVPAEPVVVTTTSSHAVQESVVAAPALVEPVRPRSRTLVTVVPRESPREAAAGTRAAPAALASAVVAAETAPVAAQAPVVVAQVSAPAPSRDRWQPLRDALSRCGARSGMFERATCELGARLAHCDGAWGETALCPVARSDYGQ